MSEPVGITYTVIDGYRLRRQWYYKTHTEPRFRWCLVRNPGVEETHAAVLFSDEKKALRELKNMQAQVYSRYEEDKSIIGQPMWPNVRIEAVTWEKGDTRPPEDKGARKHPQYRTHPT